MIDDENINLTKVATNVTLIKSSDSKDRKKISESKSENGAPIKKTCILCVQFVVIKEVILLLYRNNLAPPILSYHWPCFAEEFVLIILVWTIGILYIYIHKHTHTHTHTHTHIYIYIYKAKWSRYRPGVAQRVGRGIALLFHDRGTRRGWVVSSTPRPHFTPGKDSVPIL